MAMRFKAFTPLLSLAAIMTFSVFSGAVAQERTAGNAVETQMTWTALVSQINALKNSVTLTNNRIDAAIVCGKKGMVYAPGVGADGCIEASKSGNTNVNMSYLSSNLDSTTNLVNQLVACNKQGKLYNGSACADISNTSANCKTTTVAPVNGACRTGAPVTASSTCHTGSGGRGGYDVPCTVVTSCIVTTCN